MIHFMSTVLFILGGLLAVFGYFGPVRSETL